MKSVLRTGASRQARRAAKQRLIRLFRTPLFWILTIWGHSAILVGAALFHIFESAVNPQVLTFLDSLLWAVGIVTAVGAGPAVPMTLGGKILAIALMMAGAFFLWAYMALFVGVLIEPELRALQKDISAVQSEVKDDELILQRLKMLIERIDKNAKS